MSTQRFFKYLLIVVCSFVLYFGEISKADSVYAIPNHSAAQLNAYEILEGPEEGKLEYRTTYYLQLTRPTDVTIDVESDILFITSEFEKRIELIDARTFLSEGFAVANGASDLAGVVFSYSDPNSTHLFTVDRGSNKLFVYDWDAANTSLTPITPDPNDPNNPNYGQDVSYFLLEPGDPNYGAGTSVFGCGLALDEDNGLLYVSQYGGSYSSVIEVYDINDFENNYFSNARTINLNDAFDGNDNYAVDIDVDVENQWLYTGGYTGHPNLIRFDLEEEDPNATGYGGYIEEIVSEGTLGVIGLAVRGEYVYMTTYNNLLEAWDTDNPPIGGWHQIDTEITDAGAGVCVADVNYVDPFGISKVDDVNDCVTPRPGEEITYTICYEYNWDEGDDPNLSDFTSIYIEDFLPVEVNFVSADPNVGYYNSSPPHSYVWIIDANSIGDPNCIEITVEINNKVTPGTSIVNSVVEIVSDINDQTYTDKVSISTSICSCDDNGTIIYVDVDAGDGSGSGVNWANAYLTIEEAVENSFPCDEIWVAEGTYKIAEEPNLVNYVGLYGGFYGDETERHERDWTTYYSIISADPNDDDNLTVDLDDPNRMIEDNFDYALIAHDWVKWAVVDGFIIRRAKQANIYCAADSLLIEHNEIFHSPKGIYCFDSNSIFIRNNLIYENEQGIYLSDTQEESSIVNNTIADNSKGINLTSGVEPLIKNCIFWDNDANDMVGCYATYSCIEMPFDLYDETDPNIYIGIGEGNITGEPNEPEFENGYHLSSTSPCIDAGDPNGTYTYQRDIDKEFREIGNVVDMGADEYCDCNDISDADFNSDDIVNLPDFAEFAVVWLLDDNDSNWTTSTETYDLVNDQVIDINDLLLLAEDWLWMSCDKMKSIDLGEDYSIEQSYSRTMSSKASESMLSSAIKEPTLKEQIDNMDDIVNFLEELWKNDEEVRKTIDEKDWKEFMGKIYEWCDTLGDLFSEEQKTEI